MRQNDAGIRRITTAGVLLAITLLLTLTRIGMIPVPTPAANATVSHIPAIIAGVLEGPLVGLIVGMGFGFGSFMAATIPLFKDPLVAVLPRLFIGVTAAWTFAALRRASRTTLTIMLGILSLLLLVFSYQIGATRQWLGRLVAALTIAGALLLYSWMQREEIQIVALGVAAAVGTLTNTVLVLSMAVLRGYMSAGTALGVGVTHGVPEIIVAAVIVVAVVGTLRQIGSRRRGSRL